MVDLARLWLKNLSPTDRREIAIYACGPPAMLHQTSLLAKEYILPCQIAVEQRMACGVGGCFGCAVPVRKDGKTTMQRACIEGPVFDSAEIIWNKGMMF